jgi:16S rRNA (cytidine1402-2'-O)-methyltransferase
MSSTTKGTLYLVPAPLDFGCDAEAPLQDVMPLGTLHIAARLSCWICENAKSTRAYLKRINEIEPLANPVQMLQIQELPREVHKKGDHTGNFDARPLLLAAMQGRDMGLVSEAGMPAIADPGSSVVRAAHDLGLQVMPLTGPMSLMLALGCGLTMDKGVSRSAQVSNWKRDKPVLPLDLPTVFCIGR